MMEPPVTSVNRAETDKMTRTRSKKTNPLLMLLQRGFYRSRKTEYLRQRSADTETGDCESGVSRMRMRAPESPGETPSSWTVDRRPSCSSSRCLTCSDTCLSDPMSRVTCPNQNTWSSSWTSWTKPLMGHSQDSFQPHTSILENVS